MTWRDSDHERVYLGGTGSISCRSITEDEGLERRKQPIGFRLPEPPENEGRGWGEALWTARDIASS